MKEGRKGGREDGRTGGRTGGRTVYMHESVVYSVSSVWVVATI